MRKFLALVATVAAFGGLASTASAKPGQYTRFSESTAANGAHVYARSHFDGVPNRYKTTVDCLMLRWSGSGFSAKWLCTIDVLDAVPASSGVGTVDKLHAHALVQVLRRDGNYVFRPVKLVEQGV